MSKVQESSVKRIAAMGLCSSCGICKNVCPKSCIGYAREKGCYIPMVDAERCVNCGLCLQVCPGREMVFPEKSEPMESLAGDYKAFVNAWSRNADLRHVSASGGVVSTIVESLLKQKVYDMAFCLDSYTYESQLKTRSVAAGDLPEHWQDSSFPKSRYLAVSHEEAVSYITVNRDKRVILIGTGCAVQGFRKVIETFHLNTQQYLLIGLFCDRVFNYNVNDYFQNRFGQGNKISAIHFKNKESGGWPGNMKIFYEDGHSDYRSQKERTAIKDYFMPERCLYCIDKLNAQADISIGDNFTDTASSPLGSNSVLIRTPQGEKDWEYVRNNLEYVSCDIKELEKAQYLAGRVNHLYYGALKAQEIQKKTGKSYILNKGVQMTDHPEEYDIALQRMRERIEVGAAYKENPKLLTRQIKLDERRKNPKNPLALSERVLNTIKRRLKK